MKEDLNGRWDIAVVALRLPDGRFVFQRRDNKAPSSPKMLTFFGGAVENNEEPTKAAARELREETSLEFKDSGLKKVVSFPRAALNGFGVHLYLLDINSFNFEVYEGEGAEVYGLEEALIKQDITDGSRIACVYLKRYLEKN